MHLAQLVGERQRIYDIDRQLWRLDVDWGACGDGSDQAGRTGRAQGIAGPTFKADPGEMRRV
jgi:hypothetical protein